MTDTNEDLFKAVENILERERDGLLSGDYAGLEQLAEQKSELISKISAMAGSQRMKLSGLRARASRNQDLFESARKGLRDVSARLEEMQEVRDSLQTYGANGRRQAFVAPKSHSFERRA